MTYCGPHGFSLYFFEWKLYYSHYHSNGSNRRESMITGHVLHELLESPELRILLIPSTSPAPKHSLSISQRRTSKDMLRSK
jgi:hypothetical protein